MKAIRRRLARAALRARGYEDFDPRTNGEWRFLKGLTEIDDGVVIDVGANTGDWARTLLSFHPRARVHCLEPGSAAFEALIDKTGNEVRQHNLAVSDRSGPVVLHAAENSEMSSVFARPNVESSQDEVVQATTIDEFRRSEGIDEIALLKIDTEGNELAVLQGARESLSRIDVIQFEYGGTAVDARVFLRDFFDILESRFDLYRLWRFGMIHEPRWHELLEFAAYQNWVCIRR